MRQRANDPEGLKKGDPKKVWSCETIESTNFSEDDDFVVKPKKSYTIEDVEFNQLNFLVNHLLFIFP